MCRGEVGRKLFSVRGLLVRFCPPPLFWPPPPLSVLWIGAPTLGSAEGGHLDLFRFVPISPFSSNLFRFALLVFGNAPICSDLL